MACSSGGQLDLVDLLDAARAQFHRHADEQAVDAVFAFQVRGAGQHLLLVLEDGFGHLHRGGRRRVVGAAGLQVLHDLGAAVARAVHDAVDASPGPSARSAECPETLLSRTSGTMVSPWPPITTAVTFSTETFSSCAMKVRKRARIQHAGHADHAVLAELRDPVRPPAHMASSGLVTTMRMQLGEYLTHLLGGAAHHVVVGQQQVVAAHARLARKARR